MTDAIESSILKILQTGARYKVHNIASMLGVGDARVRVILDRLASSGQVQADRSKRWAEFYLASGPVPQASRPQLLNRKPYAPGREWERVNERLADYRSAKSKF